MWTQTDAAQFTIQSADPIFNTSACVCVYVLHRFSKIETAFKINRKDQYLFRANLFFLHIYESMAYEKLIAII